MTSFRGFLGQSWTQNSGKKNEVSFELLFNEKLTKLLSDSFQIRVYQGAVVCDIKNTQGERRLSN